MKKMYVEEPVNFFLDELSLIISQEFQYINNKTLKNTK